MGTALMNINADAYIPFRRASSGIKDDQTVWFSLTDRNPPRNQAPINHQPFAREFHKNDLSEAKEKMADTREHITAIKYISIRSAFIDQLRKELQSWNSAKKNPKIHTRDKKKYKNRNIFPYYHVQFSFTRTVYTGAIAILRALCDAIYACASIFS